MDVLSRRTKYTVSLLHSLMSQKETNFYPAGKIVNGRVAIFFFLKVACKRNLKHKRLKVKNGIKTQLSFFKEKRDI